MGTTVCAGAVTSKSIAGGFVRVGVADLGHAWRACMDGPPGIGGFRAWLAAREMVARRGVERGCAPTYRVAELAALLDVSARTAAAAVRRLVDAGLLTWADSAIAFLAPPAPPPDDALADSIAAGRGPIAIPRRLLRWLAKGARPALIATALGAVLRCVSRRRSGFGTRGRFKASWVANAFGIAERHAKAARAQLIALGWLEPQPGDQWALNRWGRSFLVRLDWAGPAGDRHPSPAPDVARSSPPDLHPEPLREGEHPEPARGGPAGASLAGNGPDGSSTNSRAIPRRSPDDRASVPLPRPDLRDVRAEDLADTGRALELYRQAISRGVIGASEADRVRFVAAVEHARVVGKANPPGLLVRLANNRWWHLLTQGDEDRAARRLREFDRPIPAAPARVPRSRVPAPALTPAPVIRSPYATEKPPRESSSLADVLARLAINSGCGRIT